MATPPPDRYAVFGNPIEHSRSPFIHARFAAQTGEAISYCRVLAPLDGFPESVRQFVAEGGRGLNVTVPFKLEAHDLAGRLSPRAAAAGAVNTLRVDGASLYGDNTDGAGLLRDIELHWGIALAGRRVLLLGAGGAARGALLPLIQSGAAAVTVINRTAARAVELAARFAAAAAQARCLVTGGAVSLARERYDVVINATASSLGDAVPAFDPAVLDDRTFAYDMMYGSAPTPFMRAATARGATAADGLGMLVEQAAEAFFVWRGVRPDTRTVLDELRASLTRP